MSRSAALDRILDHLRAGGSLLLILDYDGTLVPIADTPEQARPDPDLLALLRGLATAPRLHTIILSGRALRSLQEMLPVAGLSLAGLYGAQLLINGSVLSDAATLGALRPTIERVREVWGQLIGGRTGFLLEDKDHAIALHAKWASPEDAPHVLDAARRAAAGLIDSTQFRILDGDRFLEVAPSSADKGRAAEWLAAHFAAGRPLPVYFGDDDKDEAAFDVVRRRGGISIGVVSRFPLPRADAHLASHAAVRDWLRSIQSAAG